MKTRTLSLGDINISISTGSVNWNLGHVKVSRPLHDLFIVPMHHGHNCMAIYDYYMCILFIKATIMFWIILLIHNKNSTGYSLS